MDWSVIFGSAVVAASVSGAISLTGVILSSRLARIIHSEKLAFDREQARKKDEADIALIEKKQASEQDFTNWKRRVDFAEQLFSDCAQLCEVIRFSRSLVAFRDEANLDLSREDTSKSRFYRQVLDRLAASNEVSSSLYSKKLRSRIYFGDTMDNAIDKILLVRGEILSAAQMLLQHDKSLATNENEIPQQIKNWRSIIGWRHTNEDIINLSLSDAIKCIEDLCRAPLVQTPPEQTKTVLHPDTS